VARHGERTTVSGSVFVHSGGTIVGDLLIGAAAAVSAVETVSTGGVASCTVLSNTGVLLVSLCCGGGALSGAMTTDGPLRSSVMGGAPAALMAFLEMQIVSAVLSDIQGALTAEPSDGS
jgi:hypothetical protein